MIEDVKAAEIIVQLPRPLLLANQTIASREYTVVEVRDSDGYRGRAIGYSRGAPVAAVVLRMLRSRWVGTRPQDHVTTYDTTVRAHVMQGTHGIFWRGLSLLDCAVHDLMCQRSRQPLAVLLGAQVRPVAATLAGCYPTREETPESIAALMLKMTTFGASAVKVTGSGDLARDTRRLVACRAALGADTPLIIDLYGSVSTARDLLPYAKEWSELNMAWLEDPFRFDDLSELALLTSALPYPVGVGDEQSGLENFRNLVRFGGVRVLRLRRHDLRWGDRLSSDCRNGVRRRDTDLLSRFPSSACAIGLPLR